ncbi:MAG: PAS domain-containing protein [Candidatus Latescibacteria bacterium]|nr:PAS domain-containing protein [Candidatus Latescibacterota bacterium]MBT5829092.1 PAS domain-containing protein [Candidatus Latescibacterota bacterium]
MNLNADTILYAPCAMVMIDPSLTPLACSRKGFSVFGLRPHREPVPEDLVALQDALQSDRDLVSELGNTLDRLRRPGSDAHFRWARGGRTYEVIVGALSRGEDRSFLILFQDMTQQMQFEETRETARRFLEDILNNVQLGVVVLNRDMRITNMNRTQELFLQRLDVWLSWVEAIGMPIAELIPNDPPERWAQITDTVLEQGKSYEEARCVYETAEGDMILSVEVTPLKDQDGQVIGAIQVCEDVTERVRLEGELREVEIVAERLQAVKETAITVNHEVNNPLTTILGAAQMLLLSQDGLSDKVRARLQLIEQEVKRIAKVTQRLKDLDELRTDDYISDGPKMLDLGLNEDT